MSRGGYSDDEEDYPGQWALWAHNAHVALTSKRGIKALQDLRAALLALPERRLISRALCTAERKPDELGSVYAYFVDDLLAEQGEGVCAVGAYVWHKRVKAGMTPEEAFASLPLLDDDYHSLDDTAKFGKEAGLTFTLAWDLADRNDERFGRLSPEERWQAFMDWIDGHLAKVGAS